MDTILSPSTGLEGKRKGKRGNREATPPWLNQSGLPGAFVTRISIIHYEETSGAGNVPVHVTVQRAKMRRSESNHGDRGKKEKKKFRSCVEKLKQIYKKSHKIPFHPFFSSKGRYDKLLTRGNTDLLAREAWFYQFLMIVWVERNPWETFNHEGEVLTPVSHRKLLRSEKRVIKN